VTRTKFGRRGRSLRSRMYTPWSASRAQKRGRLGHLHEHEVGGRGVVRTGARRRSSADQEGAGLVDLADVPAVVGEVVEAGLGGDLAEAVDALGVEGLGELADGVLRGAQVADAQAGDAEALREGAGDDEVVVTVDELDDGLAVELVVGLVDDEEGGRGGDQQALDLVAGVDDAGGVVGADEVDELEVAAADLGLEAFDVGAEDVAAEEVDDLGAARAGVHEEVCVRRLGDEDGVAGVEEGLADQLEGVVGAVGDEDLRRGRWCSRSGTRRASGCRAPGTS
jgi:hypothetical protein